MVGSFENYINILRDIILAFSDIFYGWFDCRMVIICLKWSWLWTKELNSSDFITNFYTCTNIYVAGIHHDTCLLCLVLVPDLPSQVNAFLYTTMREEKSALWVNWTAPQSELPILKYEVQYRKVRSRANAWVSALRITGSPPQTSTYLEELFTDASYLVHVRAASAVGYGDWSSINGSGSEFVVCAVRL